MFPIIHGALWRHILAEFSGRSFETAYVKHEYVIYNNNIYIEIIYYIYARDFSADQHKQISFRHIREDFQTLYYPKIKLRITGRIRIVKYDLKH